jgi:hypothetical protein
MPEADFPTVARLFVERGSAALQAEDFDRLIIDLQAGVLRSERTIGGVTHQRVHELRELTGFEVQVKGLTKRWKVTNA